MERKLPRVSDPAPDFTLATTDGGALRLASVPKPVALVFLRHLA
jgi:peroxiredoxin